MTDPADYPAHAAELLYAAAVRIERYGLHQGEYWPTDWDRRCYVEGDPCCALGALALAAGIEDPDRADAQFDTHPGLSIAVDVLTAAVCDEGVSCWNDVPGRTATDVAAVLRAEADQLTPQAASAGGFPAPAGA